MCLTGERRVDKSHPFSMTIAGVRDVFPPDLGSESGTEGFQDLLEMGRHAASENTRTRKDLGHIPC